MVAFKDLKEEQIEEAFGQIEGLVGTRLDVVYQEVVLLQRKSSPLKEDEVETATITAFMSYAARLAHETEQTREEFLEELGELYDEWSDEDEEEEDEDAA